ncbi:hypothetical protein POVWA2_035890 [Plasmodium ovale wallikeri]|uniref:Uncharacterized protein n=1 Tax=Plasmodium ovale wallikeri TaxID=864142 RepID=A0A1A8Z3T2_PLAOA|nr:hypothetical protein POVWA2_035890 [Plasmodium ovale wallikeri]
MICTKNVGKVRNVITAPPHKAKAQYGTVRSRTLTFDPCPYKKVNWTCVPLAGKLQKDMPEKREKTSFPTSARPQYFLSKFLHRVSLWHKQTCVHESVDGTWAQVCSSSLCNMMLIKNFAVLKKKIGKWQKCWCPF